MKKLAFGALMIGLLAACGGDDGPNVGDDDDDTMPDASAAPDAPDTVCDEADDLVTNNGCDTGQKCAWITIIEDDPKTGDNEYLGAIGCIAETGTAQVGEACETGKPGETTGSDTCAGGAYCIAGLCQALCTQNPDTCDAASSCATYLDLGDDTNVFGVCDFKCNPVTQEREGDNAPDCGNVEGAIPRACYTLWDRQATCAPVPRLIRENPDDYVHGEPLLGNFLNSCAPGYAPLLPTSFEDDATQMCVAFCEPGPTSAENPANLGGLAGSNYECLDRQGTGGTECRYFWLFEEEAHPWSNEIGFCWTPGNYVADWDGAQGPMGETGALSCADASETDTNGDETPDNLWWGCAPLPESAVGQPIRNRAQMPFRVPADATFAH